MDRVFLENLTFRGKHGVAEEERAHAQEFRIDISVEIDTSIAASSDDIADTANYSDFTNIARSIVEGPSLKLIETIAEWIAGGILENKKVHSVTVTVRKPRVQSGVTITRVRT